MKKLEAIYTRFSVSELVFKITNLFFLIGILMSFNLWFQLDRAIPYISIIKLHHQNTLSLVLALLFLILVILNSLKYKRRNVAISLLLLIALLALDRMKCQPWVYFYGLVLVVFTQKTPKYIFYVVKYMMGTMYIWAGIHKLNPNFLDLMVNYTPNSLKNWSAIIELFPYGEILLGIILIAFPLTRITRHIFVGFHICLIAFILIFNRINSIIIPWNIYFILVIYLLHYGYKDTNFLNPLKSNKVKLALCIFALFPMLNLYSKLDNYFAFALYAGKGKRYFLVFKKEDIKDKEKEYFKDAFLAPNLTKKLIKSNTDYKIVSLYRHSLNTINVPPVIEQDVIDFLNEYYKLEFPNGRPVAY